MGAAPPWRGRTLPKRLGDSRCRNVWEVHFAENFVAETFGRFTLQKSSGDSRERGNRDTFHYERADAANGRRVRRARRARRARRGGECSERVQPSTPARVQPGIHLRARPGIRWRARPATRRARARPGVRVQPGVCAHSQGRTWPGVRVHTQPMDAPSKRWRARTAWHPTPRPLRGGRVGGSTGCRGCTVGRHPRTVCARVPRGTRSPALCEGEGGVGGSTGCRGCTVGHHPRTVGARVPRGTRPRVIPAPRVRCNSGSGSARGAAGAPRSGRRRSGRLAGRRSRCVPRILVRDREGRRNQLIRGRRW